MRLILCLTGLFAALLFGQLAGAAEPLPQRWVSAGGSLSEWVVVLGGEPRLVGVDTTSQHPATLKALPSIGYQRQLSAEGILTLRPGLLIGSEEMGPPPVLEQLKAAGVRIETLPVKADLDSLAQSLTRIGELLGDQARAAQVLAAYRQKLQDQAVWVAAAQRTQDAPRVLLLLGHAGGNPMAAGRDTSAAWLIERAGGRNIVAHTGYKAISTEALMALDPQVVIFADRSLSGESAKQALLKQNPALAATPAARDSRLVALDPTLLVGGLGPRLPEGLAQLSAALYPAAHALNGTAKTQP
ncbi:ABC transporter substrate-binding protein [Pseudomonas sp. LS44]|uniref:heme/hemin ABC transporter substrate-binding protein n=1 Tax=Pseudomonas sp. LS44 TaxID=1357074 RepID=UPI00215B0FB7|nr:ABC transporter substrate-binding protein [Pseudomonas sp. LS44]UVE17034.1 ABC transporter substrate-binding protein [Pseudomonas sp. LS44]